MFCHTILDQTKILLRNEEIPNKDKNLKAKEKIFETIISGDVKSFFTAAVEINLMDAK